MDNGPSVPQRKSLLVAESERYVREHTARLLKSAGYHVLIAGDAAQVLAAVERGAPDLILLDLWLTGTEDFALLNRLVALTGPRVVIYSDPGKTVQERALSLGAVDFIEKPAPPPDLLKRIQAALAEE